jgi:predicted pyridoxine 5'-phosphate oxidase superfamily flavin-nucleotide-binding protein
LGSFSHNTSKSTLGQIQPPILFASSLFFMDYARKTRLKLFGRASIILLDNSEIMSRLTLPGETARVERGIVITVEAFDWNCPQHITERYTIEEVRVATAKLTARIAALEAELVGRPEPSGCTSRKQSEISGE